MNSTLRGALIALAAFGTFATHDVFLKVLGGTYAPFQIIFFAVLFSFPITLILLVHDTSRENLRPRLPWWTALRTISTVVSAASAVFAFSKIPMSQIYAILFATPLVITILSVPILGEVIRLRRGLAVVVGLIGVLIVVQPGSAELGWGHFAAMMTSLGASITAVVTRKIGSEERSIVLLLYPMLTNFVIMGAILPFVYVPMPIADLGAVVMVAVLGICAMLLLIGAYKYAQAAIVAPMQYSQILWATAYGYFLFGEKIERSTIIGAVIIISSGIYILMRESKHGDDSQRPVLRTSHARIGLGIRPRIGDFKRLKQAYRKDQD